MAEKYDVIVVGAGSAGIFASLEMCLAGLNVLLLDKGKEIDERICPLQKKKDRCRLCRPCHLVSGFGGAGAFSDGKLTLSPRLGGHLEELIGFKQSESLIDYVDKIYLDFGAPHRVYGEAENLEEQEGRARAVGLKLIPSRLRHMGSDVGRQVLSRMREHLGSRIKVVLEQTVKDLVVEDGAIMAVVTEDGEQLACEHLILAPGREGSEWLIEQSRQLQLEVKSNPVDIGVRVEIPIEIMEEFTSTLYEPKLEYFSRSFDDRVRTFCVCPGGEVIMESTGGADPVITTNGFSYSEPKTRNTNFALLVSTSFTEPFRDSIAYGKSLARLANLLGGGVLVQRLGDLMKGHRSTQARLRNNSMKPSLEAATPGDLSFALPFRYLQGIIEMIYALDGLMPGVALPSTLLYGAEVKFYSSRLKLNRCMETEIKNMFAAGDGAGVSRGLVQASASGVLAGREILRRMGKSSSPPGY